VAAAHGGFYASHMRDEGPGLLASITETLTIGEKAGVPVHISHLKAYSRRAWGKAADAVALIEQARARGQARPADQDPYTAPSTPAGSTSLPADAPPPVCREGTEKASLARLDDAEQGPKVRQAIQQLLDVCDGGKSIRLARYTPHANWQGKDLAAIAAAEKK